MFTTHFVDLASGKFYFSTFLGKQTKLSNTNQILRDAQWDGIHRAWCCICLLLGFMISWLPWLPHCHRVVINKLSLDPFPRW